MLLVGVSQAGRRQETPKRPSSSPFLVGQREAPQLEVVWRRWPSTARPPLYLHLAASWLDELFANLLTQRQGLYNHNSRSTQNVSVGWCLADDHSLVLSCPSAHHGAITGLSHPFHPCSSRAWHCQPLLPPFPPTSWQPCMR